MGAPEDAEGRLGEVRSIDRASMTAAVYWPKEVRWAQRKVGNGNIHDNALRDSVSQPVNLPANHTLRQRVVNLPRRGALGLEDNGENERVSSWLRERCLAWGGCGAGASYNSVLVLVSDTITVWICDQGQPTTVCSLLRSHNTINTIAPMDNTEELASSHRIPEIRFRVLIIGRANAGKTSILQRVCETTESPIIYRGDGWRREEVRSLIVLSPSLTIPLPTRLNLTRPSKLVIIVFLLTCV